MQDGVSDPSVWGYYAALFVFILTAAQGAPLVAIAPRIAKAHWRRPVTRAAELFAVVGVLNLILFIPLIWVLPGLDDGRRSLWFFGELDVPAHFPQFLTTLALISLTVLGLALLWMSSLPDLAALRDSTTGSRQRWYARLARGWQGTSAQWNMQYHRVGILGAFYFVTMIFVHFMLSVDFLMALVPGWIDALLPITQTHNAMQAGVATVIIAMFLLRRFGGYQDYIGVDHFWAMGKLLFALSLLWFWFWFSSFIVFWYGAKPGEQGVLELLTVGPYLPVFMAVFVLIFLIPMFTMMWNPVRTSVWGPTIIAVSVLVGALLDKIRFYVPAYSVTDMEDKHTLLVGQVPAAVMPEAADFMIWVGALAGVALSYVLASKLIPAVSIWEQTELLLYKVHTQFHRTEFLVLGKKD
jgi:molybdopterin-containing oxidoreductase family membrane subunit